MPWTGKDFASRHNKKLSGSGAAHAAKQANAILRSGASEGIAIATANKQADKRLGLADVGRRFGSPPKVQPDTRPKRGKR